MVQYSNADTKGAVYGGLAGTVYGVEGIPERWLGTLKKRDALKEAIATDQNELTKILLAA